MTVAAALSLTRAMLESVAQEDWSRLSSLEQERREQLAGIAFSPEQRAELEEMERLNRQLLERLERDRDRHGERLRLLGQGRSALDAYGAVP